MNNWKHYRSEYFLVLGAILLAVAGFWNIYFGVEANPTLYQNLHVVTAFTWLFLLLFQLSLIGKKRALGHKTVGLSILFFGPLLVATTALLAVHSAHKGVVSGEGDILLVQNVLGTLELASIILLAFIFKKRRIIHGALLVSTSLLFGGVAVFFVLIGFVPQFRIEGPETFYRFDAAAATARYICLFVGILFFLKNRRTGWPIFLVSSFFILNDLVNTVLTRNDLIQPLTELVGSINPVVAFAGSFILLLILLSYMVLPGRDKPKVISA